MNGASGSELYQNVTITSGTMGAVTAYNSGAAYPTVNTAGGSIVANGNGTILNTTTINASTKISNASLTVSSVAIPSAPTLNSASSGSLAATTYYVETTWVNAYGETYISPEATITPGANKVITVTVASFPTSVTSANVYVSNTAGGGSGFETEQGSITTSAGTWTEPTSGLVAGAGIPSQSTAGGKLSVGSYLIMSSPEANGIADIYLNNTNTTTSTTTPYIVLRSGGSNEWSFGGTSIGSSPYFLGFNSSNGTVDQFDSNGQIIANSPSGYTGTLLNLEVNGASQFSVNAYGHIISGGSATTYNMGSGALCSGGSTAPTVTLSTNTDTAGNVSTTTGNGSCSTGGAVQINYANAYAVAPVVQFSPSNSNDKNVGMYLVSSGTGNFVVGFSSNPTTLTTYSFTYEIIQ